MTSIFDSKTKKVKFNSFINDESAIDLSKYAIKDPARKLNKQTGYQIKFSDGERLYLSKKGNFITTASGYKIKEIPIEPLPSFFINSNSNVRHQDGLSMLFYQSNENAFPLVNDGDISYSRIGFVHHFLRNWYFQNLNSEEYNITLDIPLFESVKLTLESKAKLYNNYFSLHSLRRQAKGQLFEKINMRLFKLKNVNEFNLGISTDDTDNTSFEPPVIITAFRQINYSTIPPSYDYTPTTQFEGSVSVGGPFGWDPKVLTSEISAHLSTDPQGLELFYGWELISSPINNLDAEFIPENGSYSFVTFKKIIGFVNYEGDYVIRLTVTNSGGLSSAVDVTVTVS